MSEECGSVAEEPFRLEEATIDELHEAIRAGRTTCVAVVHHYIDRVRAYNGVASVLVTEDGAPVPAATGAVRAMAPLQLSDRNRQGVDDPARSRQVQRAAARIRPHGADRLRPVGAAAIRHDRRHPQRRPGQRAGHLNIRGERSVTCRGDFDRHPSDGPLPPGAPPVCEMFRQQPDALERAAELDAHYGRNPDLEAMPMYGVVFSFKDPFDTKDMRSTGGGDAAYDIDFPARDHVLVEQLRNKGAIIFAKAVNTEYNGRAGDPGGRHQPDKVLPSTLGYQRSTWAGNPANPYDTTRAASLGSSSGSGVSVSANLVMCSLGEETRASCRGPANHNAVALILPHKAMLGFDGGAIGADIYCDRSGILARTIGDCAKVLDALKDPVDGYYDPRDPYTTVPRSSVLPTPYASHATMTGRRGRARTACASASSASRCWSRPAPSTARRSPPPRRPRSSRCSARKLGATLVESSDPLWTPDPDLEQMSADFRRRLARLVPVFMPDLLFRLGRDGQPVFKDFAAAILPTEFMPGKVFGTGTHGADRLLRRAGRGPDRAARESRHRHDPAPGAGDVVPLPHPAISEPPRRRLEGARLHRNARSISPTLNARSKFWGDDRRAAFKNWEEVADPRNPLGGRQGVDERIMLRELLRRVDMMVILENRLDALVRLHTPLPPGKIGGAP